MVVALAKGNGVWQVVVLGELGLRCGTGFTRVTGVVASGSGVTTNTRTVPENQTSRVPQEHLLPLWRGGMNGGQCEHGVRDAMTTPPIPRTSAGSFAGVKGQSTVPYTGHKVPVGTTEWCGQRGVLCMTGLWLLSTCCQFGLPSFGAQ